MTINSYYLLITKYTEIIDRFDHRTRERLLIPNSYGLLEIYDYNAIIICRYFVIITTKL